jgi:hypothetical protein
VQRFRLHTLRERFALWEYGRRNGIWFRQGDTFRGFAERFVELEVFASGHPGNAP